MSPSFSMAQEASTLFPDPNAYPILEGFSLGKVEIDGETIPVVTTLGSHFPVEALSLDRLLEEFMAVIFKPVYRWTYPG